MTNAKHLRYAQQLGGMDPQREYQRTKKNDERILLWYFERLPRCGRAPHVELGYVRKLPLALQQEPLVVGSHGAIAGPRDP